MRVNNTTKADDLKRVQDRVLPRRAVRIGIFDRMQIPTRRDADWPARAVWVAPGSAFAEAFRHLAQKVRRQLAGEASSSVLVTLRSRILMGETIHYEGMTKIRTFENI